MPIYDVDGLYRRTTTHDIIGGDLTEPNTYHVWDTTTPEPTHIASFDNVADALAAIGSPPNTLCVKCGFDRFHDLHDTNATGRFMGRRRHTMVVPPLTDDAAFMAHVWGTHGDYMGGGSNIDHTDLVGSYRAIHAQMHADLDWSFPDADDMGYAHVHTDDGDRVF